VIAKQRAGEGDSNSWEHASIRHQQMRAKRSVSSI
jgi:hypothetical protein